MRIIIWGIGKDTVNVINSLKCEICIIGFIDNNTKNHGIKYFDKLVYSPEELKVLKYDFLIIASRYHYFEISNQAEAMGIDSKCIIQFYNYAKYFPRDFFYNDNMVNERYSNLFENIAYNRGVSAL